MTRSLLKNRGREGLSYGAFPLSWQNTNHLQRILDGGLGLEITSWNALVHHCSFSCGFSKPIHPHSCVTRANQQRRERKVQWLPKRAALQRSSHPAQHHQQLGSRVCQCTGVFQQSNFHWHVNIDRLLSHHEGIMTALIESFQRRLSVKTAAFPSLYSSFRPESNWATCRGKGRRKVERRCIRLLFLCPQHLCLTHFVLHTASGIKSEVPGSAKSLNVPKRHPHEPCQNTSIFLLIFSVNQQVITRQKEQKFASFPIPHHWAQSTNLSTYYLQQVFNALSQRTKQSQVPPFFWRNQYKKGEVGFIYTYTSKHISS